MRHCPPVYRCHTNGGIYCQIWSNRTLTSELNTIILLLSFRFFSPIIPLKQLISTVVQPFLTSNPLKKLAVIGHMNNAPTISVQNSWLDLYFFHTSFINVKRHLTLRIVFYIKKKKEKKKLNKKKNKLLLLFWSASSPPCGDIGLIRPITCSQLYLQWCSLVRAAELLLLLLLLLLL